MVVSSPPATPTSQSLVGDYILHGPSEQLKLLNALHLSEFLQYFNIASYTGYYFNHSEDLEKFLSRF